MILDNHLVDLFSSIKDLWTKAKSMNHRSLLIISGDQREQIFLELFSQTSDLTLYHAIEELVTLGVNSNSHPFHTLWTSIPHINLSWSHRILAEV